MTKKKGKVTGLGGIFIKSENPKNLKSWYSENLGLDTDEYGHMFKWLKLEDPKKVGHTQWSIFDAKTDYLNPSKKDYMINFRVEYIESLVEQLKENGMELIGKIESFDYGKFAWVMDPDGNKVELWEPVDEVFTREI